MTVQMAVISAQHHSAQRCCSVATQTDDEMPAATVSPAATYAATPASAPDATHAAPAPVFEHVAPTPVIEYIAPAPAMTYAAPSQQLPPAYTMTTITTDINFDITGLITRNFPLLLWRLLRHRSLVHFLLWKSLIRPCTTKSIRNRSLQVRRPRTQLKPSCARTGDRSANSSGFYCEADTGTKC